MAEHGQLSLSLTGHTARCRDGGGGGGHTHHTQLSLSGLALTHTLCDTQVGQDQSPLQHRGGRGAVRFLLCYFCYLCTIHTAWPLMDYAECVPRPLTHHTHTSHAVCIYLEHQHPQHSSQHLYSSECAYSGLLLSWPWRPGAVAVAEPHMRSAAPCEQTRRAGLRLPPPNRRGRPRRTTKVRRRPAGHCPCRPTCQCAPFPHRNRSCRS